MKSDPFYLFAASLMQNVTVKILRSKFRSSFSEGLDPDPVRLRPDPHRTPLWLIMQNVIYVGAQFGITYSFIIELCDLRYTDEIVTNGIKK